MTLPNRLIVMADECMMGALGCAGHGLVKTPNLDRLAERNVHFAKAYAPSPICVPARAAFQTGLHANQLRCWDSSL